MHTCALYLNKYNPTHFFFQAVSEKLVISTETMYFTQEKLNNFSNTFFP